MSFIYIQRISYHIILNILPQLKKKKGMVNEGDLAFIFSLLVVMLESIERNLTKLDPISQKHTNISVFAIRLLLRLGSQIIWYLIQAVFSRGPRINKVFQLHSTCSYLLMFLYGTVTIVYMISGWLIGEKFGKGCMWHVETSVCEESLRKIESYVVISRCFEINWHKTIYTRYRFHSTVYKVFHTFYE